MIALIVLLLLVNWAVGQSMSRGPVRMSEGQKISPDDFHKLSDDPYSDPADEIPKAQLPSYPPADSMGLGPGNVPLPLEDYLSYENKPTVAPKDREQSKKRARLWVDFQNIHDKLIQHQARPDYVSKKPAYLLTSTRPVPKVDNFEPHHFMLKNDNDNIFRDLSKFHKPIEWTTCDEFKRSSNPYNQDDIVNIDWLPFYTWSAHAKKMAFIHRFEAPSQKTVYDYYTLYSRYTNKTVDWDQPKMLLTVGRDFEQYLIIAADKTGLYYMVSNAEISDFVKSNNMILPLASLRLKLVGEYLAMMSCESNSAAIMAREGHIPPTNKEKNEAAKILKFKGRGRPVKRDLKLERRFYEHMHPVKDFNEEVVQPDQNGPMPTENRQRSRTKKPVLEQNVVPDMAG